MGASKMRVRVQKDDVPYPLSVLRGRLKLSGLQETEVADIIAGSIAGHLSSNLWTEEDLVKSIEKALEEYPPHLRENFQLLTAYEQARGQSDSSRSLILVLEGASATGKSMLAMELLQDLAATRFISTDTIRQIIRGIYTRQSHPELYCHTYQAYKYRKSGDPSLDPVIRGFIAQAELVMPHVQDLVGRILEEGAIAIVEGVHVLPGSLKSMGANVIEVVTNPSSKTHRAMFLNKHAAGKLRTVSENQSLRTKEYEDTRIIQDYIVACALKYGLPVVEMESYEAAHMEICRLAIERIRNLVEAHD
jgi:2-phosphoglycerate kinase